MEFSVTGNDDDWWAHDLGKKFKENGDFHEESFYKNVWTVLECFHFRIFLEFWYHRNVPQLIWNLSQSSLLFDEIYVRHFSR